MKAEIIRINGERETHNIQGRSAMGWIRKTIGAPQACDVVNLRDGRVMIVDDTGMIDGRARNEEATKIYHSVCRPGTTHPICGDVAIALYAEFE